jgi:hypothetical protein
MGGENTYAFARNASQNSVDAFGQWERDVHELLTAAWAMDLNYPVRASRAIGAATNNVDYGPTNPVAGDQSYHFDRDPPFGDDPDSRLRRRTEHYGKALDACSDRIRNDAPEEAVRQLGLALHPLQDYYAHGDYGRVASGKVLHWHNETSTQALRGYGARRKFPDFPGLDATGSTTGRPDTSEGAVPHFGHRIGRGRDVWYEFEPGRQRIAATEGATVGTLREYRNYLATGARRCCRCREFFGITP